MQGQSIGSVEFGHTLYFAVSNRAGDGTELAFLPVYYDVLDPSDGTVMLQDQPLTKETDRDLWFGSVDTRNAMTDQTGPFNPDRVYSLVIKGAETDGPVENPVVFQLFSFTVTASFGQRIERMLGLSGENMMIDDFSYDAGNNPLNFRVRLFDTKANAAVATKDIDAWETGEIHRYTVTQTFGTGRQLRESHLSVIDDDPGDL